MSKIYDSFCFFNELDILDLRLNILDSVVDYFVIVESSVTHTGVYKPYYYEENKKCFSKFNNKIIHVKVTDTPNDFINLPEINDLTIPDNKCVHQIYEFIKTQTNRFNRYKEIHYGRDFYQKECVRRGLINCNDDDIILFSDCDEIPNPNILSDVSNIINDSKFFMFDQTTYYYYLNMLKENNWKGTRMGRYIDLKDYSYNELRAENSFNLNNGGWHFSYMGGPDKVKTKINSFSAQEMNSQHIINSVESNINNGVDPFFRSKLNKVNIDETYPKYLLDNIEKYAHMIKTF